jgi:hypothetical protein
MAALRAQFVTVQTHQQLTPYGHVFEYQPVHLQPRGQQCTNVSLLGGE